MIKRLLLCLLLAGAAAAQTLDGLDTFVNEEMKNWKVPGVAIAVVKDGKVILSRGYGFRDVANNKPVTPQTLFAIGSATKSFTVATLGVLVTQGKLEWDKPVREYLPDFRLYDPVASEHMTPRDLVTHRSGLPRHDMVWYNSTLSRKELYLRLRYLEPNKDFRSTFQYQNLMFMTAGYLAGQVAGSTWEEAARKNLLLPLAMNNTNFSVETSQKSSDFALPYEKTDKNEVKLIPFRPIDQIGPAGSINSSVVDMIHYVEMHLAGGKFGGKQVIAERDVNEMRTPQMVIPGVLRYAELGHQQYGMGFFITSYRGHKLVHHGGNIDGFSALVTFMPQDKIGMVILTNLNGTPFPAMLSYNVYDRLLGLSQVGWSARLKDDEAKSKASAEEAKKQGLTPRKPGTRPGHDLKEYAGEYENPAYGTVKIETDGDALKMSFHDFSTPLKHFHYEVFEAPANDLNRLEKVKVMFQTSWQGDIASLAIAFEPQVKDIVFTRAADARMKDKAFLQALVGEYVFGPMTATVSLRDDGTLILTIPGQSPYELVPVRGTTFNVKGISGYSGEFQKDASGKVTQVALYMPGGNFVAKRK